MHTVAGGAMHWVNCIPEATANALRCFAIELAITDAGNNKTGAILMGRFVADAATHAVVQVSVVNCTVDGWETGLIPFAPGQ